MKSGYAFIYFEDERDAESAIRNLDNVPFGHDRRRLSVEWSRGERGPRHREGSRSTGNTKPTRTLFVINFDPIRTRSHDIERHFEAYGKIKHVRIRRNFAFVQFETQEEATKALEHTNMSKILDRVVSVEFALRDDGERDDRRGSPRRGFKGRDASPYARSVSPPPYRRDRPSPDYGRRPSPDYGRRPSADYGRRPSPGYGRRPSPVNGRRLSPLKGRRPSPAIGRRPSPATGRRPSPDAVRRPSQDYERRPSSYSRPRSPVYERFDEPGPMYEREGAGYGRYRSRSPVRKLRA